MNVETFEQTEVVGGKIEDENSPEALALIESLGLSGQKAMTSTKPDNTAVRCPYRQMTVKEQRVYECLFPTKVAVQDYSASMIPLRVLQVAAHAREVGIYETIQVWSENTFPKDPLLVGLIKDGPYNHKLHILARWGDALESFDVLYQRAKATISEKYLGEAKESIAKCKAVIEDPERFATMHLNGEWAHIPT